MISFRFCVSVSKPGDSANWFQARERCSLLGSDVDLVTLDEDHEQQALVDHLGKNNVKEDLWIGATRNQVLWFLDQSLKQRKRNILRLY
jgi:hypothetical protein